MVIMIPILYVELLQQSNYKTSILFSIIHKQRTYFSKKYSKTNRQTLSKHEFKKYAKINYMCDKQNVKLLKYVCDKLGLCKYVSIERALERSIVNNNIKNIILLLKRFDFMSVDNSVSLARLSDSIGATVYFLKKGLYNKWAVDKSFAYCASIGDLKFMKYLIFYGANINNYNALYQSALFGQLHVIKYLVISGVDIHYHGEILRLSAKYGHVKVIEYLIKCGADIHIYDDMALQESVFNKHFDVVKVLVANGADIRVNMNYPLRLSVRKGWLDLVKYFVDCGVNVKECIFNCDINEAVVNGYEEVVNYLLEKGVDARFINKIALWHCIKKGYIDMAKELIKKSCVDIVISDDNKTIMIDNSKININDMHRYIYTNDSIYFIN